MSAVETAAEISTPSKTRRTSSESALNPLKTLAASRKISFDNIAPAHAKLLEEALARSEVGLCDYSATFSVSREIGTDFQVSAERIVLNEKIFSSPAILRLHLRHAIELTLWSQLCSGKLDETRTIAVALLSAFATTKFYLHMLTAERQQITAHVPQWLRESAAAREKDRLQKLASLLPALLPLQGARLQSSPSVEQAVQLAAD